jgi:hypothetical protein
MSEPPEDVTTQVVNGFSVAVGLNIFAFIVSVGLAINQFSSPLGSLAIGFALAIGLTQFHYLGPAIVIAWRRGRRSFAKGLMIGAALTFIISGACWALVTRTGPALR